MDAGCGVWRKTPPCRRGVSRRARPFRRLGVLAALAATIAGCGRAVTKGEVDFADGLERLALGDTLGALGLLERAQYELGGDARVYFHIGRLLAARPDLDSRARGHAALVEAVQRAPQVGLYRAALGDLLRRQRYLRASTDMLAAAVRLDPSLGQAWCLLGQNLQDEYFLDLDVPALLDSAVACYARALACDPRDDEARYRLAFLRMHHRELGAARELLLAAVHAAECPGRFGLLLAAVEYHDSRYDEAQQLVDAALHCMSPKEREAWIGLRPVLHPDSVSAYAIRADAERDSLSRRYWWTQDPTPTTLTNERLVEHVARGVEADFLFGVPWTGRLGRDTDRGDVYRRYGPPAAMFRIAEAIVPCWEWDYDTVGPEDEVFRFYDWTFTGDYVRYRGRSYSEPTVFESLPAQTNVVVRHRAAPGDWRHIVRQFRGAGGRTAVEIVYDLAALPPIGWFDLDVAAWRGPAQLADREHAAVACAEMYALARPRRAGRMRLELPPGEFVLGMQAVALQDTAVASTPTGADSGSEPAAAGDSGHRPAGPKLVWVALGRDTVEVARYDPELLMLSDLLLAHELREGTGGIFDLGGVIVVPRVDARIEAEKLHFYFEVYPSLRVLRDHAAVAVRYEVRPLPPRTWSFLDQFRPERRRLQEAAKRPVVQATFTLLPESDVERQQLSIDLSALDAGPYELEVEAVDPATGETARRSVEFDFVPPRRPGS